MTARDQGDGDGFLSRWSRLKNEDKPAEPETATEAPEGSAVVPVEEAALAGPEEAEPDAEAIADLPDIETLDKDSDYTGFMRAGVPEALRNRALRKLWLSDPVFANLDGLNDYDEDFGAIYREGVAYMKRLADAGERMTRPGAEEDPVEETDEMADAADTEDIVDTEPAEDPVVPAEPDDGKIEDTA